MMSFLERVAQVYLLNEQKSISEFCFVFPNKRSGAFFGKYLSELSQNTFMMPHVATISDLISWFSKDVEASRFEQLFILYEVYRSISSENVDFNQFQFWGDMILNDFNDVDKYLVDAKQLFTNIKRLKEINSNYLTPEQVEIIKKYWGEDRSVESVEQFWSHLNNNYDSERPRDRFVKLWEVLYDIYEAFGKKLGELGLSYSGRIYRQTAENLSVISSESLPHKRYIFVGFNVLSTAEIKIFERLKDLGIADFYWDYNSPAYKHAHNKASRFLRRYVELFKSRYDLAEPPIECFPEINVIGVSSNVGQAKLTGQILLDLCNNKLTTAENAINTAVVLPDENLFVPIVNSLPKEFSQVNITMGYPMRFTSASAFMRAVVSMHLRARKVKDQWVYFYEDVKDVLSQPLLRSFASNECNEICNYISANRVFNVSAEYLLTEYPHLKPLFTPVNDVNLADDVFKYALTLVDYVKESLSRMSRKKVTLDIMFLERYKQSLAMLSRLATQYDIKMEEHTFFHLIERAIASDTVNFVGEPLNGLQVMGVLETRALDFDNIILPSMNERIFPRKHYAKSFIPEALRRGYGMSTIEFQESIYAYYFYRLLSRSKKVYLLYDARTSGLSSGDMSRFLYQLKYLYPDESIKFQLADYDIYASKQRKIVVEKTPEIMAKLQEYCTPGSKKSLSASVIKTYVHCPLQFYLQKIEGINVEDDVKEYMDDITYGNIVHEVVERIYTEMKGQPITTKELDILANNSDDYLKKQITIVINKHYNRLGDNNTTPIYGEAEVLADIMLYTLKRLFEVEKTVAPIHFKSAEERVTLSYQVNDNLKVNFIQFIDRVDTATVNGKNQLRIVDYKTGSDKTESDFDKIFSSANSDNNGALLQLLIYCVLYAQDKNTDSPIQPILYKMRSLYTTPLAPIVIGKKEIYDYHDVKDEFLSRFHAVLEEIFDPDKPFVQTLNNDHCAFCPFKNVCGKTPKKEQ